MSSSAPIRAAAVCMSLAVVTATAQQPVNTNLGKDAAGNSLRLATKTGHVSNYDESRVKPYTLPDPLVLADGGRVENANAWMSRRRPELIRTYETEIFGRIPADAPKVTWTAGPVREVVPDEASETTLAIGSIGAGDAAPKMQLTVFTPVKVRGNVPVILALQFGGAGTRVPDPPVASEILARGWAYATLGYLDIQPDKIDTFDKGVIGATPSSKQRGPDTWGAISAWAWGVSRAIDYLEKAPHIDARRIALHGHSRLGKTALWASALDSRIAAVYASCPGEMGASLSRRDFGETVDDMAQNFPYWFAGNFQKWAGRWNDMPVDAHLLIALSAPRGVFVTGGTQDQWADPKGEFLAEVAAGPVYRLLGAHDLGVTSLPPVDTPIVKGDLGWYYHTGPHAATKEDWLAFLTFASKYLAK
jgi:dienelactone hydrolase